MEVTTTKCDVCKKIETTDEYHPPGWYQLSREGDRDEDFWARSRDICHECATKMGLPQICIKHRPE